jgi:hypothetical protein
MHFGSKTFASQERMKIYRGSEKFSTNICFTLPDANKKKDEFEHEIRELLMRK